jgi:hypothetical protein
MPTKDQTLFTIHRHWFWSNRIRVTYYERLKANPPNDGDLLKFFLEGDGMYLCLWYALLFPVCEALRVHKMVVPNAQQNMKDIYQSLKEFRNAMFHVQPVYFSPKMWDVLNNNSTQAKIGKVHDEIGEWFHLKLENNDG